MAQAFLLLFYDKGQKVILFMLHQVVDFAPRKHEKVVRTGQVLPDIFFIRRSMLYFQSINQIQAGDFG